ncbi:TerD family protein [Nocardia sp. SSK8]|uniref:TerD family protein n=1 Tax=Nocardia sp. SSK8 TaxID=3120154 RepID=UPI0030091EC9
MKLSRGENAAVNSPAVTVVLTWKSQQDVDPQALLLAETGKIRSDEDFVFYNAARHPSGAVALTESQAGRAVLAVSLTSVESAVSRIVISGSVEERSFSEVTDLTLTVKDGSDTLISFDVDQPDAVTAMMLGEFYRRNGLWKFRSVGQGWASGLRGLAEEFGVQVDDSPEPPAPVAAPIPRDTPPPAQARMAPGWYPDTGQPGRIRWWNGSLWTDDFQQIFPADPAICERCGREKRIPRFGGPTPCRWCESDVNRFLAMWRTHAWQVLTTSGPQGSGWDELWTGLRFQRIHEESGREALRPLAVAYLERLVAFAFADDEIEDSELSGFERAIEDLEAAVDLTVARRHIDELRRRMLRGRSLTQVRAGDLPRIRREDLHLDADETLYIDVNATHTKYLASGPKHTSGRLVGSSKKLRFVGAAAGSELPWAKIVSVTSEYGNVVISATTARGGGTYSVPDPEYVAAVLEGALRVSKRLVLAPGQRDTRSIPPNVKSEVWQRDGGQCCQCGDTHYLEFDHIIPLSRGGATSVGNLQILCRRCNLEKGARI